jgi:hypothetical protein
MTRASRLLAFLLLLAAALPAVAQDVAALSWLTGSWRGTGTMFGNASEAVLEVRPALGGRFVELSYRAGGFEGRAFYRPTGEGRWRATWFDNRGISFPIEARLHGQVLTADWGSAETERGRTIYRLGADGTLEVSDSVTARDDTSRQFARHMLRRAP